MYDIFEKLLASKGITAYRFCKDTGVSSSTISTWKKKNSECGTELAKIIANYFDVTIDYVMTGEERSGEEAYYLNEETAKVAQDIFENKELRVLFDAARDAEPEDLEAVHAMLLALKRKERGETE
ncbi:MAG: helix-turn-helix domain-containing protein [Lachnospiraceae bacterium]